MDRQSSQFSDVLHTIAAHPVISFDNEQTEEELLHSLNILALISNFDNIKNSSDYYKNANNNQNNQFNNNQNNQFNNNSILATQSTYDNNN